jgi:hypothetical protein
MEYVEQVTSPKHGGAERPHAKTIGKGRGETAWLALLLLVGVGGIGAVDVLTGTEIALTAFYVPIVVVAAWRIGRAGAICCAVSCAMMGVLADHLVSEPAWRLSTSYSIPGVPWWNGTARLFVYLVVGLVVARLLEVIRQRDRALRELQDALSHVRTLQGLLPICAWCKQIRDDKDNGRWMPVEQYVAQRTDARFTHGICPVCAGRVVSSSRGE